MASHLDLEEQEQLDQLKHFWKQWGNLISWALTAVAVALAGWNYYQYSQRTEAVKAAALYDELDRAAQAGDTAKVERALTDIREKHGSTAYAGQGALLAAKALSEKGQIDQARAALAWAAEKSTDEGYRGVARLRLAALLVDQKKYDEALSQLSAPMPTPFEALAADRRGDILLLQGKREGARDEYQRAWKSLEEGHEYRQLVAVKLNSLGVDVRSQAKAGVIASNAENK
jgi:predicted negative regulator of RcsB-dependent stress response